jgi:hypothetical protein
MSAIAGNLNAARLKTIGPGRWLVLAALFLFFGGAKCWLPP